MSEERLDFSGRVVLVTGAGRGMGAAHAHELARRGARVVVNDLGGEIAGGGCSRTPASAVVEEIEAAGGEAVANTDSVATAAGCSAMVRAAEDAFGRLDGIVHNAGISNPSPLAEGSEEDLDAMLKVHLYAAFNLTREAWPLLARDRGRVVLISSAAGLYGVPELGHYAAAKVGLLGLARVAAAEGKELGIGFNVLAVAAHTRMMAEAMEDTPNLSRWFSEYMHPEIPAAAAAWLLHPDCPSNGAAYECWGPHVGRILIAETAGITKLDLTAEDMRDHFAEIEDRSELFVPEDADDFHTRMVRSIVGAGAAPPEPDASAVAKVKVDL